MLLDMAWDGTPVHEMPWVESFHKHLSKFLEASVTGFAQVVLYLRVKGDKVCVCKLKICFPWHVGPCSCIAGQAGRNV